MNVAEEVRDVRRAMPRAIITTLVTTLVLYLLITSVAVLTVPAAELAESGEPLALVYSTKSQGLKFQFINHFC